ncbi:MAG: PhzF family phenazine biosynthesis protein [Pirellulaceae bacterium]
MPPLFLVDAFSKSPFGGNPAVVCLLDQAAPDSWMQSLAMEMNQAETAFVYPEQRRMVLRWFTPRCEVDLCGHATLAAAFILWQQQRVARDQAIVLQTRSGALRATLLGDGRIELDFPQEPASVEEPPAGYEDALGLTRPPISVLRNRMDWLVHVDGAEELRQLSPDFPTLAKFPGRGWIITSGSDDQRYDFLSRFFGPSVGIDEDSVTGSAHCCLVSYWSEILSKSKLVGYQASRRGGVVTVESRGPRAILSGHAALVFSGHCHASWR